MYVIYTNISIQKFAGIIFYSTFASFFIVLDLRLTKVGVQRYSFFLSIPKYIHFISSFGYKMLYLRNITIKTLSYDTNHHYLYYGHCLHCYFNLYNAKKYVSEK